MEISSLSKSNFHHPAPQYNSKPERSVVCIYQHEGILYYVDHHLFCAAADYTNYVIYMDNDFVEDVEIEK